jgi:hypothetical protein
MNEGKIKEAIGYLHAVNLGLRGLYDLLTTINDMDPTAGALTPSIDLIEVIINSLEAGSPGESHEHPLRYRTPKGTA